MVPLKSHEVLASLEGAAAVKHAETEFHLFGVTRCHLVKEFARFGVTSFDSTSPLKQAFMDDRDNYYTPDRTYIALRVPQVGSNLKLKKRIATGEVDQAAALRLERACLAALREYDAGKSDLDATVGALVEYERLHDGVKDRSRAYREVLKDVPWRDCPCVICRRLGIQVLIFRGAERNRRRGFHNLWVTHRVIRRACGPKREVAG
jgi:hypothetical protein